MYFFLFRCSIMNKDCMTYLEQHTGKCTQSQEQQHWGREKKHNRLISQVQNLIYQLILHIIICLPCVIWTYILCNHIGPNLLLTFVSSDPMISSHQRQIAVYTFYNASWMLDFVRGRALHYYFNVDKLFKNVCCIKFVCHYNYVFILFNCDSPPNYISQESE